LSYPNDKEAGTFQGPQAMIEMALLTVEGARQVLLVAWRSLPRARSWWAASHR